MFFYKRVFLIVLDSLGIGNAHDASAFNDYGSNTLGHILEKSGKLNIPNLEFIGITDFIDNEIAKKNHVNSFTARLNELSSGKDTITGHWEMMGLKVAKSFKTFYDNGFPKELIDLLERETKYKFIGNYAFSGTEILKKLGEEHIKTKSLILYTSTDSVMQIAAHEKIVDLNQLYKVCEIARKICLKPKYFIGRIIARPFLGNDKNSFYRDNYNRRDFAVLPFKETVLDILEKNKIYTLALGKIGDIFSNKGIKKTIKIKNNNDGMDKIIFEINDNKNDGLYFLNLVDFDSNYGHRRDVLGYKNAIEEFDKKLGELMSVIKKDDLLILTSDHGNDPTWAGTDHTREQTFFIAYSKKINNGKFLGEMSTFANIGATILHNFNLKKNTYMVGKNIEELFYENKIIN
ncbi:MAG: phosphopentomutase [Bacilli bacterium]|nr:phosphopentomutase [Bacilli bacterium]